MLGKGKTDATYYYTRATKEVKIRNSYLQIHKFLIQNSYSRRENEGIGDGKLRRTSKKTAAVEREAAVDGNSRRAAAPRTLLAH